MVRNFRLTTVYFIFFLGFQAHASNGCYLQSYINHNCFRFVAPDFVNSAVGPCVPSDAYTIRESLKKKGYYFIVMNNTASKKCVHQFGNIIGIGDITPYECIENHSNLLWEIVPDNFGYFFNSGYFYIKAKHSGMCLGMNLRYTHGKFARHGLLIQRDCDSSDSLWRFTRPEEPNVSVDPFEACME